MKYLIVLAGVTIFSICWDQFYQSYWHYYENPHPVSAIVSELQAEIHCNTLKLQELGFTKWVIIMSYSASLILLFIFIAILLILIWMMMERKSITQQVEIGIQVGGEIDLTNPNSISERISKVLDHADEQVVQEQDQDERQSTTTHSVCFTNSWGPESGDSDMPDCEVSSIHEDDNSSSTNGLTSMYTSILHLHLELLKNQQKRTSVSRLAAVLQSRIGIEIFTSYFYIYVQDSTILG